MRGLGHLTGVKPPEPFIEKATGDLAAAAPYANQFMPGIWNMIHGPKGSTANLAKNLYASGDVGPEQAGGLAGMLKSSITHDTVAQCSETRHGRCIICPHCGKELTPKDIYTDKKGWTFCRACMRKGKGSIKIPALLKRATDIQWQPEPTEGSVGDLIQRLFGHYGGGADQALNEFSSLKKRQMVAPATPPVTGGSMGTPTGGHGGLLTGGSMGALPTGGRVGGGTVVNQKVPVRVGSQLAPGATSKAVTSVIDPHLPGLIQKFVNRGNALKGFKMGGHPNPFDKVSASYKLEGDVQGVGLRKTLHQLLEEKKLPGVVYNDAYEDSAYAHIPGRARSHAGLLKELAERLKAANREKQLELGKHYNVTPIRRHEKLQDVSMDDAGIRKMMAGQGLTLNAAQPIDEQRKWIMERFRLAAKDGLLSGKVPQTAFQQLQGEAPIYHGQVIDQGVYGHPKGYWQQKKTADWASGLGSGAESGQSATIPNRMVDPSGATPAGAENQPVIDEAKLQQAELAPDDAMFDLAAIKAGNMGLLFNEPGTADTNVGTDQGIEYTARVRGQTPLPKLFQPARAYQDSGTIEAQGNSKKPVGNAALEFGGGYNATPMSAPMVEPNVVREPKTQADAQSSSAPMQGQVFTMGGGYT